jgi:hypothetical protein
VKAFLQCTKYNPQQYIKKVVQKLLLNFCSKVEQFVTFKTKNLCFKMNLKNVTYLICNHQNNLKSLERKIIVDNSNFKMYISQRNKAKYLVRKPCFSVVHSNGRYKRKPKSNRQIIRDGSTNSMTPADRGGAGGPDSGGAGGPDSCGAVEGPVEGEGGVEKVGVETGAKMGAGAGPDPVISSKPAHMTQNDKISASIIHHTWKFEKTKCQSNVKPKQV